MFEVGQKVRCIEDDVSASQDRQQLVVGQTYEIVAVESIEDRMWVGLKGVSNESPTWCSERFEAIKNKSKKKRRKYKRLKDKYHSLLRLCRSIVLDSSPIFDDDLPESMQSPDRFMIPRGLLNQLKSNLPKEKSVFK